MIIRSLAIVLLFTACRTGPPDLEPVPSAPPTAEFRHVAPGHVMGVAPKRVSEARKNPRVYLLCHATGEVLEQRVGADLHFDFDSLSPGRYRVTIQEPTAERDSWRYHHREVELTTQHGVEVAIEPIAEPAFFRIRAEDHTPPLVFLLTSPDLEPPSRRDLGEFMERKPPSEHIVYSFADDGHGPFDVPPLRAGRYQIMTIANDWEPGDPPVALRTWPLELRAGETRTVILRKRLVEVEIR